MNSFGERYKKQVVPRMMEKFAYKSPMAVPRIVKVCLNTGFGKLIVGLSGEEQKKVQESILKDMALISGQKPSLTQAKKSIASFKLRKGLVIGAKVTLRGKRMEDFIDRLIWVVLPRCRDFQGIPAENVSKTGNLTIGLKEQIVFPEITPESAKKIFGLEVTVVVNSKIRDESLELLKLLGFPIRS